jgi:sugar phosphate isomerase/epimerase
MRKHGGTRAKRGRTVLAALLSGALLVAVGVAGPAAAPAKPGQGHGPDKCKSGKGAGIPDSKISVQLWTFASFLGFGDDEATQQRVEEVMAGLSDMGYRNIEPYSLHGFTAEEYRALAKSYGLRIPSRHHSTDEATWDQTLADAKALGQKFTGSGGSAAPGIDTFEDTLETAATLNRLGQRSVRNGTGKIFVHNHQGEFRTTYVDPSDGETKSAWQILVENTDRRYVAFQVDVLWAADGGADPVELLEQYGKRIELLHIKDGINVADPADATPVPLGEGEMNFDPIIEAAKGKVRYFVYEQDPPFGDPTYDPFASAQAGIDYLDCVRV